MSVDSYERVDAEFEGDVIAPHLADDKHPEGLGFRARKFNPKILQNQDAFSSATQSFRDRYGAVILPGLSDADLNHVLNARPLWQWG